MRRWSLTRNQKIAIAVVCALVVAAAVLILRKAELGPNPQTVATAKTDTKDPIESLTEENASDPELSDEEAPCNLQPPGPLLEESSYADYQISRSTSSTEESATLENGIHLKVTTTGCEDFASAEFEFETSVGTVAKMAPLERLNWVRGELTKLSFKSGDYYTEKADFLIKNFDRLKPGSMKIWSVCNDSSVPGPMKCDDPSAKEGMCDHDCGWNQGGATEFETKDEGARAKLIFRHFYSA
jgi:hypothetical protein